MLLLCPSKYPLAGFDNKDESQMAFDIDGSVDEVTRVNTS
jgi:hypothetical protein